MSENTIKIYLIVVVAGGLCGMIAGLILALGKRVQTSALKWKTFVRGSLTVVISLCFLSLLVLRRVDKWTAFLSVGMFLILQEYFLFAIQRVYLRRNHDAQSKEE